jgi:Ribbon-helix-helix protein, copG family
MASTKVTFTLDQATIARLQDAAARLSLPKSEVVREAIQDFHERIGQLSERERLRLLRTFDEMVPRIPTRSLRTVENELSAIRRARKAGGRKSLAVRRKN